LKPLGEVFTPLDESLKPLGEVFTPLDESLKPLGEVFTPLGESLNPFGEVLTPPSFGNIWSNPRGILHNENKGGDPPKDPSTWGPDWLRALVERLRGRGGELDPAEKDAREAFLDRDPARVKTIDDPTYTENAAIRNAFLRRDRGRIEVIDLSKSEPPGSSDKPPPSETP
jgi:hypothetical protein